MPRKKKILLKKRATEVEVETSDDQIEVPRRSLRTRSKIHPRDKQALGNSSTSLKTGQKDRGKNEREKNQQPEYAYDADSELDQQKDDSHDDAPDENDYKCSKMMTNTESENDMVEEPSQIYHSESQSASKSDLANDLSVPQVDKENFTPPGSHSTPALVQRAVRNLEDSLFGFNNMASPLSYSPSSIASSQGRSPTSSLKQNSASTINSTASSWRGKRKSDRQQELVNENMKKGRKKRTKKEAPKETDNLEELREQFKEVEMHELAVEFY